MENNPKKSKALIITIIVVLLLLILGYFLFTKRDQLFGTKGIISTSKIFAPLLGSSKQNSLTAINGVQTSNAGTTTVEAGENIPKGSTVYLSGFNANNVPIVSVANSNSSSIFGIANEDISQGSTGTVTMSSVANNTPENLNNVGTNTYNAGGSTNTVSSTAAPTVTLSADQSLLPVGGGDVTLTWTTTNNPTSCTASGGTFTGSKSTTGGNEKISGITQTTTYTLNCKNNYGSSLSTIFVTIDPNLTSIAPGTTHPTAAPTVTLSADQSLLPVGGGDVTLTWTTTNNPTSCTASGGTFTGSKSTTGGNEKISGITQTTTYTLNCKNTDGISLATLFVNISTSNTGNYNSSILPTPNIVTPTTTTTTPTTTTTKTQCSDGIDNNGNNLIDAADPGCHTDQNASNALSYDPTITTETYIPNQTAALCAPADPLVFTPAEQKQLDLLLRKFYLITSTLKTDDDVSLAQNDILQNQTLVTQVDGLIKDCEVQKADPAYTGPQTIYGNPYYNPDGVYPGQTIGDTYLPDATSDYVAANPATYSDTAKNYSEFELMFYIW